MDTVELTLDSATAFKSADGNYLPTDTPEFYIPNGIQNIVGIKILEVAIPCSWYTITTNRDPGSGQPMNHLIFVGPGISPTDISNQLVIPPGNYTAPQLASQLTSLLNTPEFLTIVRNALSSVSVNIVGSPSVTYDSITGTFTWSFDIDQNYAGQLLGLQFFGYANTNGGQGVSQIAQILGFPMGGTYFTEGPFSGGITTFTMASGVALVQGPPYISVNSKRLGTLIKVAQNVDITNNQNNLQFSNQSVNTPTLAMIPLSVPQGGILTWQDPEKGMPLPVENAFQIQSFDLFLTQGPYYKQPLQLNGLSFTIKLLISVLKNTQLQAT